MTKNEATQNRSSIIRWTVIAIYFLATLFSAAWHGPLAVTFLPIILVFTIFISACLHGKERYGLKNLILFLL